MYLNNNITSLYIHIPFCHQLCHYCDFAKMYANDTLIDAYMRALLLELKQKLSSDDRFSTVYIGGGTPSILPKQYVEQLFLALKPFTSEGAEITFEMNPEDVSEAYVQMLFNCGVNRVSLGVQSFSDQLIQRVGRNHTASKSVEAIEVLKKSSIQNITVDLIFAMPGQTFQDVEKDVALLCTLDLPHISLYSLILEKRTRLYLEQDQYDFVDEDLEAQMYTYIIDTLEAAGYAQYEMSNFSKSKCDESRHNLAYWHQKQYYGIGLGAHQFIGNRRSANTKSITKYIQSLESGTIPEFEVETLTEMQQFEEFCFLAFRDCQRGLVLSVLESKYPMLYNSNVGKMMSILHELERRALIEMYDLNMYRLTKRGKLLANEVFQAFIHMNI